MEALTAELLGDVGKLHDDVKRLHELLPTMTKAASDDLQVITDKVGDALQIQSGHYLAAAEKLASVLKGMSQEIDRQANQAALSATVAAKLNIQEVATEVASAAIAQTVGAEVGKVVGQLHNAAVTLANQTEHTQKQIKRAAQSVSWGFGRILALVVAASFLSGGVLILGEHYLGKKQGQQLSAADQSAINNWQGFTKNVWPRLTKQEQERIAALAQQAAK